MERRGGCSNKGKDWRQGCPGPGGGSCEGDRRADRNDKQTNRKTAVSGVTTAMRDVTRMAGHQTWGGGRMGAPRTCISANGPRVPDRTQPLGLL